MTPGLDDMTPTDMADTSGDACELVSPGAEEAMAEDVIDVEGLTLRSESHRGAFGEFGGESAGLIDRSFRERILLVGVTKQGESPDTTDELLDELERLVDTAGADVVARVHQRRRTIDPATYIGKGKAEELRDMAIATDCDTVVFDDELSPAQQFNLEKLLGRSALDRTAVIMDIFAQNASSVEGKAQVELAQLKYLLPRLRGKGNVLSQQGAGIGTRGPGETKLEVDRRRITRRMHALSATLRHMDRNRVTQNKARNNSGHPQVVIVGYTNAGKSTLLNRLTDADVLAEDRLFATLDATTRRMAVPGGEEILLTDTVGFVQKLPHQLIEAFRSTLSVVNDAALMVHVVDASGVDPNAQISTVRGVLAEIEAAEVPELLVFNKIDDLSEDDLLVLRSRYADALFVSAIAGLGIEELIETIAGRLRADYALVNLDIPFARGDLLAAVHRFGEVLEEEPGDTTFRVLARVDRRHLAEFEAVVRN